MSKKITDLNKTTGVADAVTGETVVRKVYKLEETKSKTDIYEINTEIIEMQIASLEAQKVQIEAALVDLNDTLAQIEE